MIDPNGNLILIVEDSPDLQWLLEQLLVSEGYAVACALNGREALQWLRDQVVPPRLVLLDLMMPVMDGMTLYSHMQDDARLKTIPVVFMTADSHPELKVGTPPFEIVRKPIDTDQLLSIITRI